MHIRSSRSEPLVARVHRRLRAARLRTALLGLILSWSAVPVQALVPGQVSYQGLLLDSVGAPITGSANFVFRLYDAAGGGSLLWTESHAGVTVTSGVYDVALGSTTPLDANLVGGGDLYLEIQVDGETLSPRQRLLVVPYALRAAVAETAERVGGIDSAYLTEYLTKVPGDGADPPNFDPSEGLVDGDGDTLPNFVDADNDGDGLSDAQELSNGSNINVVTPIISGFSPSVLSPMCAAPLQIHGQNFTSGLSVVFGSQSPTPYDITPTSFMVDVSPQPSGTVNVTVTLTNGETFTNSLPLSYQENLLRLSPSSAYGWVTTVVLVEGENFGSGVSVVFGSQSPTPYNITPTSFKVDVGPQPAGIVDVVVSRPGSGCLSGRFTFN